MTMAEPNWDDLRIFLAVARHQSLSGAGKTLRLDPATIGRRIQRLEDRLAARLFIKSPQGYHLSEAGQDLLDKSGEIEQNVQSAFSGIEGSAGDLGGSIRVGAPDGVANYLLPQVVAAICDENPRLSVHIVALPRVFDLSKREADMAITVSAPTTGRLTVQRLTDYHLSLAASVDYLASHPPINSRADLAEHRLIGYIPDMIFDKELDYLKELGDGLSATLCSNSFSVQLNWARRGAGVCIVHDFAIPAMQDLRRILVDEVSIARAFYLVRHADDRKVERLNRFAELLARQLRLELQRLEGLA